MLGSYDNILLIVQPATELTDLVNLLACHKISLLMAQLQQTNDALDYYKKCHYSSFVISYIAKTPAAAAAAAEMCLNTECILSVLPVPVVKMHTKKATN